MRGMSLSVDSKAKAMLLATLDTLIEQTTALHNHLCPRQVLGIRMGMLAAHLLDLDLPQSDKRLYTFVETDGCFADGVSVATGCWLGHRTMRLMDFGKVAATFVDSRTGLAYRVNVHPEARAAAVEAEPRAESRWHAQLAAYQYMPNAELLRWHPVRLSISLDDLISRPGVRVTCDSCGEEILNERELIVDGRTLCRSCAGESYVDIIVEDHAPVPVR